MKGFKMNRWYLAFVGLLLIFSFYPNETPTTSSPLETEKHDSDYYMQGVIIHLYDEKGNQLTQMESVKLAHFKHQDQSLLESPLIQMNQTDGSHWQLKAKQGKIIKDKNLIEMIDQVVIEGANQQATSTQINTQHLIIDLQNTRATTDKAITISHQYYQTTSIGMDMDFKNHIIDLNQKVVTETKP